MFGPVITEILCFLLSMKCSYFFDKDPESQDILIKFKKILMERTDSMKEEKILLKLSMFLGSVYEVLYMTKLIKKRNLNEDEIDEISESFWGKNMLKNEYIS